MAIRATCDDCFMEFKVPDNRAGKAFRCKGCGAVVRVPRPGERVRAESAAPTPGRSRRRSSSGKTKSRKRKKSSAGSKGVLITMGVVIAALGVIGVVGFLLMNRGGEASSVASSEVSSVAGETAPPALSGDEQKILDDFQQLSRTQFRAAPEQRKAAMEAFAAERSMTPDEVFAIVKKERDAREAANRVENKWQPLAIGRLNSPSWPSQTNISVPSGYGGAAFSVPGGRTPFLLTSVSISGAIERHVFNLATSQLVGRFSNSIPASHNDRLSTDGRLLCLPEGSAPNINLRIADVTTGEMISQISGPELIYVDQIEFTGPKTLMVLTPLTSERTRDRKRRCLIYDARTGSQLSRFEREFHFSGAAKLSVSPDGQYLLMTGKGKSIEVIDLTGGEQICALDLKDEGLEFGQLHSVSFSPDGRQIAVLEERPLMALRLYIIAADTGKITRKIDLYGATITIGGPLETSMHSPPVWFPNGRYVLLSNVAAVDTATGRRVWQAQGNQSGVQSARLPSEGGILFQRTKKTSSELVALPIDFDRIASTQASWPTDAALRPGMTVSVSVDMSVGGLGELNDVLAAAMKSKLEGLGFSVADTADRELTIGMRKDPVSNVVAVAFAWNHREAGKVLWESIVDNDSAMVPQLGHLVGRTFENALGAEGVAKFLAYPIPWFLSSNGQWALPVIDQISHID